MRLFYSVLLFCAMAFSATANAAVVTIEVSDMAPSVNDVVIVDIFASTSGVPVDTVGGFSLSFLFDEARLSLASAVTLGSDFIGAPVQLPAFINGASANIFGLTGANILLASLELTVLAEGVTPVTVSGQLFRGGFQPVSDLVNVTQTITVQATDPVDPAEPVNAPASIALVSLALALLVARRKR
ncbi:hypothetical protein DRW07_03780 [Alteromonas sediminis]|uniref:PEP-CTERM sorting domain-containing protein n=1 Tax=Alteromonas sediminis TaxID=2259342 RepID=A0A3N5Y5S0_9ALTE|nr:hypothetical protein [Alteromonas sediminis]RPJ68536.1 hypothetical protein DRW07_03780 [Alteromonas sediminis]